MLHIADKIGLAVEGRRSSAFAKRITLLLVDVCSLCSSCFRDGMAQIVENWNDSVCISRLAHKWAYCQFLAQCQRYTPLVCAVASNGEIPSLRTL